MTLCWLDVFEDPIVGTSQTGDHFWNKVFDMYVEVQIKRRPDQITGKWRLIKEQVGKFNTIYKKYDDDRRSGENDAQVMEQARQAYTLETGGKFAMYEAWTILKDRLKFLSFTGVDGMAIKKKMISRIIESSDEDQLPIKLDEEEPLDTNLFGPDAIPRHPPPKVEKKTPQTSGSSDATSSRSSASELVARLEQLGSSKQAFIDKKSDALDSIHEEEKKTYHVRDIFICGLIKSESSTTKFY
uniref:uncharacterized protein LOC122588286 n=1 Tax=Erigeron canadensis TaxID=72917 RepID=UPI001CB982CA|nr:uncharacterized protein LOC122588286 [Erigeron canadensis]